MNNGKLNKIHTINNMFIPTTRLKKILDDIKYIMYMSSIENYTCEPLCMLVTGETGTGKTEFIKQYQLRHPYIEEKEKTKIPVLVSLLPKARHPKPVVATLLRDLGDELQGKGGDTEALIYRLVTLSKATEVELIIIDEFQHAIETKNNQVVYDIADLIKTLINKTKIPVILFGLPWSSYILDVNQQLARRFSIRNQLINYSLESFSEFQKLLQKIEQKLPVRSQQNFWQIDLAFKLFAASKGNLSSLMNDLIKPAAINSIYDGTEIITLYHFATAFNQYLSYKNEANPFLENINDIIAYEQTSFSYWNSSAPRGESRVVDGSYRKIKFDDLRLKDVF